MSRQLVFRTVGSCGCDECKQRHTSMNAAAIAQRQQASKDREADLARWRAEQANDLDRYAAPDPYGLPQLRTSEALEGSYAAPDPYAPHLQSLKETR